MEFDYNNWGNKRGCWCVDHIKPLANFNLNSVEAIKRAVHYTNLQPLWYSENAKKGSKEVSNAAQKSE